MYSRGIKTLLGEEIEMVLGLLLGTFSYSHGAVAVGMTDDEDSALRIIVTEP